MNILPSAPRGEIRPAPSLPLRGPGGAINEGPPKGPFILNDLPFDPETFGSVISARTFKVHHGRHHRTYVDAANLLAEEAQFSGAPPLEIVRQASRSPALAPLFRNGAQAWNHDFYWQSLNPAQLRPTGALARDMTQVFGSYAGFSTQFGAACDRNFGSGWVWLVRDRAGLPAIEATGNADTPALRGIKCLLAVDVWEHAYYLDHANLRRRYVDGLTSGHLNWRFAEQNFEG